MVGELNTFNFTAYSEQSGILDCNRFRYIVQAESIVRVPCDKDIPLLVIDEFVSVLM